MKRIKGIAVFIAWISEACKDNIWWIYCLITIIQYKNRNRQTSISLLVKLILKKHKNFDFLNDKYYIKRNTRLTFEGNARLRSFIYAVPFGNANDPFPPPISTTVRPYELIPSGHAVSRRRRSLEQFRYKDLLCVSIEDLLLDGFHSPNGREIRCIHCHGLYPYDSQHNDVKDIHKDISPTCRMVMNQHIPESEPVSLNQQYVAQNLPGVMANIQPTPGNVYNSSQGQNGNISVGPEADTTGHRITIPVADGREFLIADIPGLICKVVMDVSHIRIILKFKLFRYENGNTISLLRRLVINNVIGSVENFNIEGFAFRISLENDLRTLSLNVSPRNQ